MSLVAGAHRRRQVLFLAVGGVAAALVSAGYAAHVLNRLELDSVDARFSIRGTEPPRGNVVVVAIDAATFSDLGVRFPFPRSLHARVVGRIARDGPRAIAYDVQFTEPTTPREDNALVDAVAHAHGRVVLATTEVAPGGHTNVFGGDDVLRQIGARAGNANLIPDVGGVFRRLPIALDGLRGLAVAAADVASGRRIASGGDERWIDFAGPPGTVPSVSFSRVLQGRLPPGFFRGKVVVVGATAPSLQDVHATSTTGNDLMAGPEIQANAIETALSGFPLRSAPAALDILLVVLLALLVPVASVRLSPLPVLALALGAGGAFAVAAQLAFNSGTILAAVYPLAALVLSTVGALAVHYSVAALERSRVRTLFGRFVPAEVVQEVLARTDDDLRLAGARLDCTVLFSDLRGFTSFAESLEAEQVIELLNRYLTEMSDAIMDQGGTLVSYMGDGIMAVFGAPLEYADHADRALAAAEEMLKRLDSFNAWVIEHHGGEGFRMGVGLNSGPVMSGNVGSERRVEYAAVGDTTNTAARLEGMTKGTPHQLFVSDSTRARLRRPFDGLAFVGELEVRGRRQTVKVWTLVSDACPAADVVVVHGAVGHEPLVPVPAG
jgi:adenylate cyclase